MSKLGDILVVENDDLIRALLTETLSEEGYAVRSVSDRTGMHCALNIQPPDLLLCDVDLDRGPGPSLIDDVHVLHSAAVPMVLLTTNVWTARSLARQGLTFCLLKPYDLDDLLASVASNIHSPVPGENTYLLERAVVA
jgi:DNA-binding NtrC family response regulator